MQRKLSIAVACALLFLQLALQINLAMTDTQTSDEAVHLFSGYQYLASGNYRYNPEHPPLMKSFAAFPLIFMSPTIPDSAQIYEEKFRDPYFFGDIEQFRVGSDFLYNSGNDQDRLLFSGRVMMALITLLLGVAVYLVSVYFWGWGGGVVSVALFAMDPLINGHGHLITNDVLVSLTTLLTVFTLWLFFKNRSWSRVAAFGVMLGLALLSKFTALILLPFTAIAFIIYLMWKRTPWRDFLISIAKYAVALVIAYFVIIAGYGFHLVPAPAVSSISQALVTANSLSPGKYSSPPFADATYNIIRPLLVPPEYYLGLTAFVVHAKGGHEAYLLGQNSQMGWWYYFPVVFLAKTPLITLGIVGFAIIFAFLYRRKRIAFIFLLLAVAVQLGFSMLSNVNIGLRHIMPVYPLLFVMAGVIGANLYVFILLGIMLIQTAFIYPHYISFFNFASGGPWNGYKIAVDSNTDWGQDGKRIQEYINEHSLQNIHLEYWNGNQNRFEPVSGSNLIIGATALQEKTEYEWLRDKKPTAQITPSVFLFSF